MKAAGPRSVEHLASPGAERRRGPPAASLLVPQPSPPMRMAPPMTPGCVVAEIGGGVSSTSGSIACRDAVQVQAAPGPRRRACHVEQAGARVTSGASGPIVVDPPAGQPCDLAGMLGPEQVGERQLLPRTLRPPPSAPHVLQQPGDLGGREVADQSPGRSRPVTIGSCPAATSSAQRPAVSAGSCQHERRCGWPTWPSAPVPHAPPSRTADPADARCAATGVTPRLASASRQVAFGIGARC